MSELSPEHRLLCDVAAVKAHLDKYSRIEQRALLGRVMDHLSAVVEAQRSSAPAQGTWMDIETAPKDGTDFLALCEFQHKHHQMVGCFAPNGKFASWPGRSNYHPTHWMPLPPALSTPSTPSTERGSP